MFSRAKYPVNLLMGVVTPVAAVCAQSWSVSLACGGGRGGGTKEVCSLYKAGGARVYGGRTEDAQVLSVRQRWVRPRPSGWPLFFYNDGLCADQLENLAPKISLPALLRHGPDLQLDGIFGILLFPIFCSV